MNHQRIGLVRHGLTDWNAAGRIQGQTDIPLNDHGREQAMLLANRLTQDDYHFDLVISSGLKRAEETAVIIAKELGLPLLEPHEGLLERAFGIVEGTTAAEREAKWGVDWRGQDLGQETDEALRMRASEALEQIAMKTPDQNVLIVSHGSWLAQLFISLFGEACSGHIGNLSFTVIERTDHGWKPILLNCSAHVEQQTS